MPHPRRHGGARSREWAARLGFRRFQTANHRHRPALCAIAHWDRTTQYSRASASEPGCRSVSCHHQRPWILGRPVKPGEDDRMCVRILATSTARVLQIIPPTKIEGAGNAGCPRHPQPRVVVKNTRVSHHRYPGTPGIPCAMVLTVSFVLSPVIGFLATVTPRSLLLGSLTPAPRRQDHTTSPSASASFVWRAKSKLKRSFRMRGLQ
jgi:hypothetical protein